MSYPSWAVGETPQVLVKKIFDQAKKKEIAKDIQLQAQVSSYIDFEEMARKTLGKEYQKLAKSDKKWYASTLQKVISKTVYPKAPEFFSGVTISYEDAEVEGNVTSLNSTLTKKGEETEIKYVLTKEKDQWKIIDIAIDDESWVETIRDEVQEVMEKEKWAGLKKRLNSRLKKLK